jgi:hypothetical protein
MANKKSDLVNRERVNLVLDKEIARQLRKMSQETDKPMGRLTDKALMQTYGFTPIKKESLE